MTAPILPALGNATTGPGAPPSTALGNDDSATPFAEMVEPQTPPKTAQGSSDMPEAQDAHPPSDPDAPDTLETQAADALASESGLPQVAAPGQSLPVVAATNTPHDASAGATPPIDGLDRRSPGSAQDPASLRPPASSVNPTTAAREMADTQVLARDPRSGANESPQDSLRVPIEGASRTAEVRSTNRRDVVVMHGETSPLGSEALSADAVTRTARTEDLGMTLAERLAMPTANGVPNHTPNASSATLGPVTSMLAGTEGIGSLGPTLSSTSTATGELTQPFASQAWQDELGGRLQWMADGKLGRAQLRLNPAGLGPLEVSLSVQGEEVTASFQAQHAATREAVEQALPRLREMLAQSGLQLADANVGQQQQQEGDAHADQRQDRWGQDMGRRGSASLEVAPSAPRHARAAIGALDLYA